MVKLLWQYNFLNYLEVVRGVVLVSQVICTNTNLVHHTCLTNTIAGLCVSNVSMRLVLDLPLLDKLELCVSNLKSYYFIFMRKMGDCDYCGYHACG
jgi:hypothetical protein